MRRTILACILGLGLAAGCTSSQLASDEQAAVALLKKIDAFASDPAAGAKITATADQLLALDPSSPFLQKTNAAVKQAVANGDLQKVHLIAGGSVHVLNAVASVASATAAPVGS